MAKNWYPVVDYTACVDCGTCVNFCPHNVYDAEKAPSPVVKNPADCVDHCHGCGSRCPAGAITYVGDDTGWTPPNGKKNEPEQASCSCNREENSEGKAAVSEQTCCSCGCGETSGKMALVEYLYLDLQSCDRCIGTDSVLDDVMMTLMPALNLAGFNVEYKKVEMKTAETASQYRFLSSPTIRVNGRDICASVKESSCGCCGGISGTDVDCRVFEYNGETYEVPPAKMLSEAILQALFGSNESCCSCGAYEMPENLKKFFEGKENKCGCGCKEGCC